MIENSLLTDLMRRQFFLVKEVLSSKLEVIRNPNEITIAYRIPPYKGVANSALCLQGDGEGKKGGLALR